MKVIVCCENNNGMMFNNRRVSRDEVVIKKIIELTKGCKLWMNNYSYALFENEEAVNVNIAENVMTETAEGEYCFVENESPSQYEKWIDEIIIFRWNRDYPSDLKFDLELNCWDMKCTEEFPGDSHEKITMEVYKR